MKKDTISVVAQIFVLLFIVFGSVHLGMILQERMDKEEIVEEEELVFQDTLDDWTTLQMAIVMTESKFNPRAIGATSDWGVLQITPIYVKEVNRILKEEKYNHEDAFDIEKSFEMFEVMQQHYNPTKDLDKAIKYHNRAGWYAKRVKENIEFIQRMEEVRRMLVNQE